MKVQKYIFFFIRCIFYEYLHRSSLRSCDTPTPHPEVLLMFRIRFCADAQPPLGVMMAQ